MKQQQVISDTQDRNKYSNSSNHIHLFSDAVDSVTSLYNQVEEQAHVLVQRSNLSLEHLEYLLQLREMEGHFMQVHFNSLPSNLMKR